MAVNPDDITVINSILAGDVNAFELLLERYENHVARLVAAHVPGEHVAEVAHEAFIRVYTSLASYSPVKPFNNWLTTIATRSCHDFWREKYRRKEAPVSDLSEKGQQFLDAAMTATSVSEFEKMAHEKEARELLDVILDQLSPMNRMVLTLTYLEELSVRETAERLGISVPNVKVRAFRAKQILKGFLKRHGIQGGLHVS